MATFKDRFDVTFSDGRRLVDWGVVWRIFYDISRVQNYLDPKYQTRNTLTGLAKVSALPESIEIDFDGAASQAQVDADTAVMDISMKAQIDDWSSVDLKNRMNAELGRLDSANGRFRELLAENSRRNEKALALNVGFWSVATTVAEGTRDLSVIVLGIGGTMLTGGAAGGVLAGLASSGTASALGSIAKAQDQGLSACRETVGKVALNASIDFTFGLISFGMDKNLKLGGVAKQAIVIVVNTAGGAMSSLAMPSAGNEKKAVATAVGTAYVDAVVNSSLDKLIEARFGKKGAKAVRGVILPHLTKLAKPGDAKAGVAVKTVNALTSKSARIGIDAGASWAVDKLIGEVEKVDPRMPIHGGAAVRHSRLSAIFP